MKKINIIFRSFIQLVVLFLPLLYINGCRSLTCSKDDLPEENLGEVINSPYDDFAVSMNSTNDTLIFTSNKGLKGSDFIDADSKYGEDIFQAVKKDSVWEKPVLLQSLDGIEKNEGTFSTSRGVKLCVIALSHSSKGLGGSDLYKAKMTEAGLVNIENLSKLNSVYWESQPALSPEAKTLIFASDRPGGIGGVDLWESKFDGKDWSAPENLGDKINTTGNEYSPMLGVNDGSEVLLFSSDGKSNGKGELDIYYSYQTCSGEWIASKPVDINTEVNEAFPFLSKDGYNLYYSTDKLGGCRGYDIYSKLVNLETPVVPVKGKVLNALTDKPVDGSTELEFVNTKNPSKVFRTKTELTGGDFSIPAVNVGSYKIKASAENYNPAEVLVKVASCPEEVIVKMESQCFQLSGKVVNSKTGMLLNSEAMITFKSIKTGNIVAQAKTSLPESNYTVSNLCPDKYEIFIVPINKEDINDKRISGYIETADTMLLDKLNSSLVHKVVPWEINLVEQKIPFFVTGYYRLNTPGNLKELRNKLNSTLKKATYIENPGNRYDAWALTVQELFQDSIVQFVNETVLPYFAKDSNRDKALEINIWGYADPRKLIGNYLESSINSDGINIRKGDILDRDNRMLTLLRAYFTKQYLDEELSKSELYKKLKAENRIKFFIKGEGEDQTPGINLELKRRIKIVLRPVSGG